MEHAIQLGSRIGCNFTENQPTDRLDDDLDSLDMAELFMFIEDDHEVGISPERANQIITLQDLNDLVVECAAAQTGAIIMQREVQTQ